MLFSLITIAFSLSRTGMIMLITIIVLPILLRYKSNKHKVKFYKKILFIVGIVVLFVVASNITDLKGISGGATTERTIETRLWRWFDMIE